MLTWLGLILGVVSGSYGDQECPVYRGCLRRCLVDCPGFTLPDWRPRHVDITPFYSTPFLSPLPCPLQCRADCTSRSNEQRSRPTKYYGKWPFVRLFGCDEFASFLFSLANAAAVALGYCKCPPVTSSTFYSRLIGAHASLSTVVWLLSAQFHARESILSEQLDYAGAIGLVHITLGVTWSRFLFRSNLAPRLALLSPLLCLSHLAYLFGSAKFDFGLNMQLCVFIGLSTVAANVLVYLTDRSNERINRNLFAIAVLSVASSAALALEVFDFAPIYGLIDSHAFWHAVTIPAPLYYYKLILLDYQLMLDDKLKLL